MARRPPLHVWLYGQRVGTLTSPSFGKLRFDIDEAVFDRWPPGSTVLSLGLPLLPEQRPNANNVLAFFEGLLPEDSARTTLEARFGVTRGDSFGLLAEIGRDCAGAVVVSPEDSEPADRGGRLGPIDLAESISELGVRPLGAGPEVRVSLAGLHEKLLAVRDADGAFWRPLDGYPSNVILKPESPATPGYARNEVLCTRLAHAVGLTPVSVDLIDIDGRPVVVVPRYDRGEFRLGSRRGTSYRKHQEDTCQALAIDCRDPHRKYEAHGGPSLRAIARQLDLHGMPGDRGQLLAYVAFNVAIGNTDAHGKNLSIVHERNGRAEIAPLYDVSATVTIPGHTADLAMRINAVRSVNEVTVEGLQQEGRTWGLPETVVVAVVRDVLTRVRDEAQHDELASIDPTLATFVRRRATDLLNGDMPTGSPSAPPAGRRPPRRHR